jgi:sulfoxide reductase heme-binding subunit YedZ
MAAPGPLAQRINGWLRRVPTWPVYLLGFGWIAWLFWRGATDYTLVEPIDWLERAYGEKALQLLVATLAVTPLRRFLGINLLKFRRALGLLVFFFVLAHFLVWALLDVQALGAVWADILKRPYITIGMAAFAMLVPLALSSNDRSLRRLGGARWRKLHWLTYAIAVLGAVHYVWLARGFAIEPLVYLGLILALLATRLPFGQLAAARA